MGKGGDAKQLNEQKALLHNGVDDFYWSATDEPHATRRKAILAKHPEIKQLYGHCGQLKYKVFLCMIIQGLCAYTFRHQPLPLLLSSSANDTESLPWWMFWVTAYVIGGTCNHMLMMALHELSHNLGFKKPSHNKWFAMIANIPIAVPSAVTFKRYHMEHHKYQGVDGIDVDIPTELEGRIFQTPPAKLLFCLFQVAFYGIRPSFVNPKPPGSAEFINAALVLGVDALVAYAWGLPSLLYLLASSWLGMGLHPVAGHFIAEHYVFPHDTKIQQDTPETYSYYGIVNLFTFNVGYHNEHHDFPFIPGSRLPQVNKIAAQWYDPLPHHTSYCKVFYDYITCPNVTAYSRVKRGQTAADPDGVVTDRDNSQATTTPNRTSSTLLKKSE